MKSIFLVIVFAPLLMWLLAFAIVSASSPKAEHLPICPGSGKKRKNVLLVVAHPDDESMFFAPTLLSLTSLGCYDVRVLCLSNGNAEGLGSVREMEMLSACSFLKIPLENVDIINDPLLQDGHNVAWSRSLISQLINRISTCHNIDMIITFDSYGISGHPNHVAVYQGVCEFLFDNERTSVKQKGSQIEAWKLESVNFIKKYSGPIYVLWSTWRHINTSNSHLFYSGSPRSSIKAMQRHKTQWLWYRRLFVIFSVYTYMNSLHRFPV
ncbi:hypothetical protein KP509_04G015700 [Ceratopteris richardii]|uniref:N-acetylglucosaminylphosphatidylinositol deacetylase n=1 Tax=Ceratopteris richardii TaxID=49495 RepID=A0A8T2UQM1_CERRI|nr:hypothetical protein KP509_04G015700 [Ceratopteris richardii]